MEASIERLVDARRFLIHAIEAAASGKPGAPPESPVQFHATLFCICIIAEALNHIPPDIQNAAPAIPWRKIRATRNHILHDYRQIDSEIVQGIVEVHFPVLDVEIGLLIEFLSRQFG